ncbi:MAG: hypothetical protein ABW003_17910 [Microvirga sp.]
MDEVYNGYRIAIRQSGPAWVARISHVRGSLLPITAIASQNEGTAICLERARAAVGRYIRYLDSRATGWDLPSDGANAEGPP